MNKSGKLNFLKEILWLLVAAIITALVLLPIVFKIEYVFIKSNAAALFIFVYYLRYVVNFKNISYLRNKWVRVGLIIINVNLFVWILNRVQEFISLMDNFSLSDFALSFHQEMNFIEQTNLLHYIKREAMISGVGCLILIVVLLLRIAASFFTQNKKLQQFLNE